MAGICLGNFLRPLTEAQGLAAGRQALLLLLPTGSEQLPLPGSEELLCRAPGLVAVAKPSGTSTERLHERLCVQRELHVVSRLDLGTSGVLPLATGEGLEMLQAQYAAGMVSKELRYRAS